MTHFGEYHTNVCLILRAVCSMFSCMRLVFAAICVWRYRSCVVVWTVVKNVVHNTQITNLAKPAFYRISSYHTAGTQVTGSPTGLGRS